MAIVYSHTRLDNNTIFYIGIGNEYKRAYSKYSRNSYWNNIVSKIDYKVNILFENLTWEDACKKETELISLYGRKDLNTGLLANMTDGGDGVKGHSKETINKIIKVHKGRIQSEEEKLKRINSRCDYKHSEQTKEKIKLSNLGKKFSDEHLKNLSLSHIGKISHNAIITLDLNTGVFYDSLRSACNAINKNYKTEYATVKRGTNKRLILI